MQADERDLYGYRWLFEEEPLSNEVVGKLCLFGLIGFVPFESQGENPTPMVQVLSYLREAWDLLPRKVVIETGQSSEKELSAY